MQFLAIGVVCLIAAVGFMIVAAMVEKKKVSAMPADERQLYIEERRAKLLTMQRGPINVAMICPHCQEKGEVRTKHVDRKKGVSGGKATAAVLTAGVSLLATGLSRVERLTQAYCGKCGNTWEF